MAGETVILLQGETMGRGDDALGAKLVGGFLRALATTEPKPAAVVFYSSAVRLLAKGTPHRDALAALEDAGADLLACVTCLEHYGLVDGLELGTVSNMREIVQRVAAAAKVVTI